MATKTYKMSDDTASKLAALMEQMKKEDPGISWDACFGSLVKSYENQKTAEDAGLEADAKAFRMTLDRVYDLYRGIMAVVPATEERVRAEAAKEIGAANTATAAMAAKVEELEKKLEGYEETKAAAARADALQRNLDELKRQYEAETGMLRKTHAAEIREAIATEREKYATQAGKAEALQKEIESLKHQHEAETSMIKQTAAAELREAIAREREKHAEQLTGLQQNKQESKPKRSNTRACQKSEKDSQGEQEEQLPLDD